MVPVLYIIFYTTSLKNYGEDKDLRTAICLRPIVEVRQ